MSDTVRAVYEDGVFRPVDPVADLPNGCSVVLTVQPPLSREPQRLSQEELHALLRSKYTSPEAEELEPLWQEAHRSLHIAMSNVRDPEVMRQAAERMDRLSAEVYKREGLLDIVVPILREIRDNE